MVLHNIVLSRQHAAELMRVCRGLAGRVVMTSSMDVYRAYGRLHGTEPGPPDPIPADEDAPLRQRLYPYRTAANSPDDWRYHYDKIPAEQAVLGNPDLPGTVLRLPMVLGPHDPQHRLFPYLKPMLDRRPTIVMQEDYAAWRSTFGYVDNVAEAMALACTDPRAAGRVYNVADADLSMLELGRLVAQAVGWPGEFLLVPREELPESLVAPIDTAHPLVCSAGRIRRELGYRARVPLEEAIRRTVAWERDNPPDPIPPGLLDYAAEDAVLGRLR